MEVLDDREVSLPIAAGSWNQTSAMLWDLEAPAPSQPPFALRGGGYPAFSRDGRWLALGRDIWDLSAPDQGPVFLHRGLASDPNDDDIKSGRPTVSGDGSWLFFERSGSESSLYRLRVDDLVPLASLTAGRNFTLDEWKALFGREPYRKGFATPPVHVSVLDEARRMPLIGDLRGATGLLRRVRELDPEAVPDAEALAERFAAPTLVARGREPALQGEAKDAIATFSTWTR